MQFGGGGGVGPTVIRWCLAAYLLSYVLNAPAQRTLGLSLNSAYRTRDEDVLLFGGGVSAAQPVGKRTFVLVSLAGYLAHKDEGTYTTGPRWLPVGDTTSAVHRFSDRTNAFMLSFGLMGYTRKRSPDHGLCWLANGGIGADRFRYIQDVTPFYTGPYKIDEVAFYTFAALGAGLGYTFPMRGADFTCTLLDNWAFPWGQRYPGYRNMVEHHAAILSLSYRWGL